MIHPKSYVLVTTERLKTISTEFQRDKTNMRRVHGLQTNACGKERLLDHGQYYGNAISIAAAVM